MEVVESQALNDFFRRLGRVCLGSLAGAGLGAVSFFALDGLIPPAKANPFAPGYHQNDNRFADGYVQDSNPFAGGYVQDKSVFGFG